mmetsp:Transcript_41057/g.102084  ORF Transcript_41057/g.102084 Transcript_41057/m.102084 type:complete len:264 (+) Transcript_41057:4333-5124(+)
MVKHDERHDHRAQQRKDLVRVIDDLHDRERVVGPHLLDKARAQARVFGGRDGHRAPEVDAAPDGSELDLNAHDDLHRKHVEKHVEDGRRHVKAARQRGRLEVLFPNHLQEVAEDERLPEVDGLREEASARRKHILHRDCVLRHGVKDGWEAPLHTTLPLVHQSVVQSDGTLDDGGHVGLKRQHIRVVEAVVVATEEQRGYPGAGEHLDEAQLIMWLGRRHGVRILLVVLAVLTRGGAAAADEHNVGQYADDGQQLEDQRDRLL